ncbi:flavin monoamine oxidase family protein [Yinghuangia seranimata]|uniref:flavin monoamine oxidase family protein n=1 Tax=Yinghuangia seranimata TaxID=408067 RepID=UPI00248C266C|nr:FAD-dependent oxidoreductase [Yinghuangia seranimata]MDI2127666.1 FAD-dependent oxidoreductase [Yinghuangia seranimata]
MTDENTPAAEGGSGNGSAARPRTRTREADVVVVGAGLAGLSAARDVLRAGYEPLVLEARDRVGGRLEAAAIGGGLTTEMGGQWSAPRNSRLRVAAQLVGAEFFRSHDTGASLLEVAGKIRRQRGKVPPLGPGTLVDLVQAQTRLDRQARRVPAADAASAPDAARLDASTLGAWLDRAVRTRTGRAMLDVAVTTIWGAAPHQVNLLQALAYISGAGGFEALTTSEVQDRVVGGSTVIAEGLAAGLGDRVLTGVPVTSVVDTGSGVEVRAGRLKVKARRVIVAVPPVLAAELEFEPGLPKERLTALQALPMAAVTKVTAVYDRPFWRDRGLSGQAFTVRGPVTATFDNSPPTGGPGVLLGFVPGDRARDFAKLDAADRRRAALATFTRLFGPEAGDPGLFLEKDWAADPWARGCYFGLAAPGTLTGVLRVLARPIGRVHWAGTETATDNYGGMDGAVASGERAAAEVLTALTEPARTRV